MKIFYCILVILLLPNCSFDNKSGIWNNELETFGEKKDAFKDFIKISSEESIFNKKISLEKNFKFILSAPIYNKEWKDIFYREDNNLDNFKYNAANELIYKSKKLTRANVNHFFIFIR